MVELKFSVLAPLPPKNWANKVPIISSENPKIKKNTGHIQYSNFSRSTRKKISPLIGEKNPTFRRYGSDGLKNLRLYLCLVYTLPHATVSCLFLLMG